MRELLISTYPIRPSYGPGVSLRFLVMPSYTCKGAFASSVIQSYLFVRKKEEDVRFRFCPLSFTAMRGRRGSLIALSKPNKILAVMDGLEAGPVAGSGQFEPGCYLRVLWTTHNSVIHFLLYAFLRCIEMDTRY